MTEDKKHLSETRPVQASRDMARQARQMINLMASRIPGARAFIRAEAGQPGEAADRVAVVSDLHLGDSMSTVDGRMGEKLCSAVADLGELDELILLGDVFDFWQAPMAVALRQGKDVISELFLLDNVKRIVYVPGNHDHHACRMYYELETARRLKEGNLEAPGVTIPMVEECPIMEALKPAGARVPLYMTYPFRRLRVRGKSTLFTHGHLLGFFERSLWMNQAMMSSLLLSKGESLSLEDVERFASPYYEMLSLSASMPGVVSGRYRLYRTIMRAGKALGGAGESRQASLRDTTVEENAVELEALLDQLCEEKPDYFVYGHTHKAGKIVLPLSGVVAVNSGCWIANTAAMPSNSIVEVSDDARILAVR